MTTIDVAAVWPRGDPGEAYEVRVAVIGEVDESSLARLERALAATVAVRGPVLLDLTAARASGRRLLAVVRRFHQDRAQRALPCRVQGLHPGNLPPLGELTRPELALVHSGPPAPPVRTVGQSWPLPPPTWGPAGYGPAGYGPAGYGTAGYGPAGYGPSGFAPGRAGSVTEPSIAGEA